MKLTRLGTAILLLLALAALARFSGTTANGSQQAATNSPATTTIQPLVIAPQ